MPQILPDLPPIAPAQVQTVVIDFGNFLPPGVTLVEPPTVNVTTTISSAPDPDPESRISMGPVIGTVSTALGGTGQTDTAILTQFADCISGVVYIIEAVCERSDGDTAEAYVHMRCQAPS